MQGFPNNFVPGQPQDLRVVQDAATLDFDLSISDRGDLEAISDFSTALLLSLLTDARADDNEVALRGERRGWIGDAAPRVTGFTLGSKLWVNEPDKATSSAVNRAVDATKNALSWLIRQGLVNAVEVTGELTGPNEATLSIVITARTGEVSEHHIPLWQRTAFVPTVRAVAAPDAVEFSPLAVPGLVTWIDANLSETVLGDDCDVIQVSDQNGVFSFTQPVEANRPRKLITGPTDNNQAFFDLGVDDFMTVGNQLVSNLREGTIFIVYAPKASAPVDDGRVLSLGANGSVDGTGGISIRQDGDVTSDSLQLVASNGELDFSADGPGGGQAYGAVFQWGPRQAGGSVETEDGQLGVGSAYNTDISAINDIVIGAGFDGAVADPSNGGEFYLKSLAIYNRRVLPSEANNLLSFGSSLDFSAAEGEQFSDCTFFTDGFGHTP